MANFSKKIASTVSATAIVASAMSTSLVSAASEFLPYAEALVANNVIGAQSTEAGFRLNDQITRAELAKVAANLGQYTKVSCSGNVYADVNASLGDLCEAVETLASAGVINKTLSHFRPNDNVTRAEMTKMILGALGEKASTMSAGYADVTANLGDLAGFINRANELKCANTSTYFRPAANSSRGEAFKIASCAAKINVNPVNPVNPVDPTKPVVTNGSLTVSAVGNATAQYVPQNAASVNIGTVKVLATGGDVKLSSLTINRSGLGDPKDITISKGVRAMVNGKIVSGNADYYSASSQQANIYFVPALEIKNGQSVDVTVLLSLGNPNKPAQPNSQHQFAVTAVNGTNVSAPITLGIVNTTSYKTTEVSATLKNPTSSLTPSRMNQRIVDVEIGGADRDVTIEGFNIARGNELALKKTRPAYDLTTVLANPKVYLDGKEVGTATITRDKIFVTGLNTMITSGRKTFQLRADVLLDSTVDSLALKIEDSSDVSGVESATKQVFTVNIKGDSQVFAFANVKNQFTADTTKKTVAVDTSNVELLNATLSSDVPLVVNKINVKSIASGGTVFDKTKFSDGELSLKNNGRTIATLSAAKIYESTGSDVDAYIVVDKDNKANITIEADLEDSATGKIQFEVTLVDVKDINGRTAKIANLNVEGAETEVKGADIKVVNTNLNTKTARVIENSKARYTFSLRANNKSTEIDTIVIKNSRANGADLSKVFTLTKNNSTLRIGGQDVDIDYAESSITADTITLKFVSKTTLQKDQDESVELTLKTLTTFEPNVVNKDFQLKLETVNTASLNRIITGVVHVGQVLDVTSMNSTNNQPVKFTINNPTETAVSLTGAKLSVVAVSFDNNTTSNVEVTSLRINGVIVDATTNNEFTLDKTKLEEIGINQIAENSSVDMIIENNTLTATSNNRFTVRLKSLSYGNSEKEVNVDARSAQ